MGKLKKTLIIFISSITIFVVMVILFISIITKYLIEKYDEKYTGRQITLDWAYVNPFSGYIHFNNFIIYEFKSGSVFFSANGISANIAMLKLFSKTYEITEFTVNHPYGIVIQNKKVFNFSDLIEKFSSKDTSNTVHEPIHFNIGDCHDGCILTIYDCLGNEAGKETVKEDGEFKLDLPPGVYSCRLKEYTGKIIVK